MVDDMTDQKPNEIEAGRAQVRELLIRRLQDAGLTRAKGQGEPALMRSLDNMMDRLAYMTPDNLRTLADVVIDLAQRPGGGSGVWPSEVAMYQLASGLQVRPFRMSRVVWSWLGSVEGPVAEAGGYLVELFRFLRRFQRPPLPGDMREIRDRAAENNRQRGLIADRVKRDVIRPDDQAWMEAYLSDEREARGYVDQGHAGRGGDQGEVAA